MHVTIIKINLLLLYLKRLKRKRIRSDVNVRFCRSGTCVKELSFQTNMKLVKSPHLQLFSTTAFGPTTKSFKG